MCDFCNGKGYVRVFQNNSEEHPDLYITQCMKINEEKLLRNEGGNRILGVDNLGRIIIDRNNTQVEKTNNAG